MFTSYEILCMILKTYTGIFSKAEVHGCFPLPKGPKIIAANHTLASDSFHLPLILDETICFLLQDGLFDLPFAGTLLKLAGQIPVQQNHLQSSDSLTGAHTALIEGKTIVIFPEGELVPPGKRIRGRTGAVRLALKTGVPIIPLGMYVPPQNTLELGFTRKGCKHSGIWQISGNCHLNFGAPWKPLMAKAEPTNIHALTNELMDSIYKLVSETQKELTCVSLISPNPILQ